MRVGLFGGSFNPPHIGHSLVCFYLLETTGLDEIWLIPTWLHALKREPPVEFVHRFHMCDALAASFGGRVKVSEIERHRGETSYTIDTVRSLRAMHPTYQFEWIIGADILNEIPLWKDSEQLKTLIEFRVLGRAGFSGGGLQMPEVSSSEVRQRLRNRLPVGDLLPARVLDYIQQHNLYQT